MTTNKDLAEALRKHETRLKDETMGELAAIKAQAARLVGRAMELDASIKKLGSDPQALLGATNAPSNLATNLANDFELMAKSLECLGVTADCAFEVSEILR